LNLALHTAAGDSKEAIALRVIADHIRTISFAIADGQLPSNTGAGYVIRRILRRAVRYGYSTLKFDKPFLFELVALVADKFADIFPELKAQQSFVEKVVLEEETSFLRTLSQGIKRFEAIVADLKSENVISGKVAFELFDTFGFPIDLTKLMASELGLKVDEDGFNSELNVQKNRSKSASASQQSDWVEVNPDSQSTFIGYDELSSKTRLIKYRSLKAKDKESFQMVLEKTPFYAESGGQIGDTGILHFGDEQVAVFDTKKENDLIIHFVNKLPSELDAEVSANINVEKRNAIIRNHSATHLLQAALREVLGSHIQQKGSLVNADYLRFDFSHFSKVTDEEISKVEQIVNQKILDNISLDEKRNVPIVEAEKMGATMLFGEKYGEFVRVITFDSSFSSELCGGCHVKATGAIGLFKIIAESAVAAGVRRIEAYTGTKAIEYTSQKLNLLDSINALLNNPKDSLKAVESLKLENLELSKRIEEYDLKEVVEIRNSLLGKVKDINGIQTLIEDVSVNSNDQLKNLIFMLKADKTNFVYVLGAAIGGKANVHIMVSEELVKQRSYNASSWIKEFSPLIKGGGGGQPFYASAGGTDESGISSFLEAIKNKIV
jgi:alanyl-tRNA synthetase